MTRTITVITPENISLTYEAAGIASRFMAVVVDLLIQIATALLVLLTIQTVVGKGGAGGVGPGSLLTGAGIVFVSLILPFAYAIVFEMLWSGRTPGKRLFRLRTVRDGGYPINLLSSIIRNLLRVIDFGIIVTTTPLVLCGLPGLICMFFSPTYKRIGDYAAGTVVIIEPEPFTTVPRQEKKRRRDRSVGTPTVAESYEAYLPYIRNLDRLTYDDYQILRRFVGRRRTLDLTVQAGLGERLARPLISKLDIDVPIYYQLQYADVLQAIERRYAEERGIFK